MAMAPSNLLGACVVAIGSGPPLHFQHPGTFAQSRVHACPLCWVAFPSGAPLLTCRHKMVNPGIISLRECGIHVVDSPATIGAKVKEVLG